MTDKDRKRKRRFEARAKMIKALAHPTRLLVVDELTRGERCVCTLAEMTGIDVSTMSRHLAVLRQAGLVEDEKRGLQVWYSLRMPCILNFFDCVEEVLKANIRQAREEASK